MLYIIHCVIMLIWVSIIVKKEKYSWHAVLSNYMMALLAVDTFEVVFFHFLRLYVFRANLLAIPDKDYHLGLIFSDGVILPLTSVVFCHYAANAKRRFLVVLAFTLMHVFLELLYLNLGFLQYNHWSIAFSAVIYLAGFSFSAKYAYRVLRYNPPMPYALRIAGAAYAIPVWFSAVLGGQLLGLFIWSPHLFKLPSAEDRVPELSITWAVTLLSALIAPRIQRRFRPLLFMSFAALETLFCIYAHYKGWLIFYGWNTVLTALRWFVAMGIVTLYDKWESKYTAFA